MVVTTNGKEANLREAIDDVIIGTDSKDDDEQVE